MTEPGQDILALAAQYNGEPATLVSSIEARGALLKYVAEAETAKRLARCCDRLNNNDYDDYLNALAAWRALGEVTDD